MQKVLAVLYFFSVLSYFSALPLRAQLDNIPFRDTLRTTAPPRSVSLQLDYLGYHKNNEYFNEIADGYTLFGQQVILTGQYRATPYLWLEGGISFQRDFGVNAHTEWLPVLRLKYQKARWAFLFGTLEGHLNHGLIEPLFDFERLLSRRLENGFQGWYRGTRFQAELWVDWSQVIYRGSPFRERIDGGANLNYDVLRTEKSTLRIPFQLTGLHLGGQIDTSSEPLVTRFNWASGVVWQHHTGGFVETLSLQQYGVWYLDFSPNPSSLYDKGWGLYSHVNVRLRHLGNIGLSYWKGTTYESSLGGDLFSSATRQFDPAIPGERVRELLILRLVNNIRLNENTWISLRAEPFWDFGNQQFEFSTGLYLTFREGFQVLALKE